MYKTSKGVEISGQVLVAMKSRGLSESDIACEFNISRMQLYRIRKKNNWLVTNRSTRGQVRVPDNEKRARKNAYMADYYQRNKPDPVKRDRSCFYCGKEVDGGPFANNKYVCPTCISTI